MAGPSSPITRLRDDAGESFSSLLPIRAQRDLDQERRRQEGRTNDSAMFNQQWQACRAPILILRASWMDGSFGGMCIRHDEKNRIDQVEQTCRIVRGVAERTEPVASSALLGRDRKRGG